MSLESGIAELFADPPPITIERIHGLTVRRVATWIPVAREVVDDALGMQRIFRDVQRRERLRSRGFVGLVRCARCRRPVRCVAGVVSRLWGMPLAPSLYYGSTCWRRLEGRRGVAA